MYVRIPRCCQVLFFFHLFTCTGYIISCFFLASTHLKSIYAMERPDILKPESLYTVRPSYFPVWYFLVCSTKWVLVYVHPRVFLKSLEFFFMLVAHSTFLLFSLSSHILLQNCFIYFASGTFFLLQIVGSIILHFLKSCFVCIIGICIDNFFSSFFSQYLFILLIQSYCQNCPLFFLGLLISIYRSVFILPS